MSTETLARSGGGLLDQRLSLGGGEQRLLAPVAGHGHHHTVKQTGRPLDDIQVAVGQGVEAAGINDRSHARNRSRAGTKKEPGRFVRALKIEFVKNLPGSAPGDHGIHRRSRGHDDWRRRELRLGQPHGRRHKAISSILPRSASGSFGLISTSTRNGVEASPVGTTVVMISTSSAFSVSPLISKLSRSPN